MNHLFAMIDLLRPIAKLAG